MELQRAKVSAESIRGGLANLHRVFQHLQPDEQRELVRLVLKQAQVGDRELILELYGGALGAFEGQKEANRGSGSLRRQSGSAGRGRIRTFLRFEAVLNVNCNRKSELGEKRYYFSWEDTPSTEGPQRTESACRRPNPVRLAREWQASMEERGESRADLARRLGVSRARVTQVLSVLDLDAAALELLERRSGPAMVSERALRGLKGLALARQRERLTTLAGR